MFKKWLLLVLLFPHFLWAQESNSIKIYQENNLWGLSSKKPITPAVYDTLFRVEKTLNYIAKKHKINFTPNNTGVISEKGKVVIPHEYLSIMPYSTEYVVSQWQNGQTYYGIISFTNEIILNIRFKNIQKFDSYWLVTSNSDQLYLYNLDGSLFKTIEADSIATSQNSNFFYTYKEGKVGLNSSEGNVLFMPIYKDINSINGHWYASQFSNWQVITHQDTTNFICDTLKLWVKDTYILGINGEFQIVKENQRKGGAYNAIQVVSPSLAITKKSVYYGAVSIDGYEILPAVNNCVLFESGYFYTYQNKSWSLYDSIGVRKSVFKYDSIGAESDGLFPIKRKGKWGFMDRVGKELIHCIYDSIAHFKDGKAIITYFGKKGIINKNGEWETRPIYDEITGVDFEFYTCRLGSQYFLKRYSGELIYFSSNPIYAIGGIIYENLTNGNKLKISAFGTIIIDEKQVLEEPTEGWSIIEIDGKYGFVDKAGLLKITYRYDSLKPFNEGLAPFKLLGNWGFINVDEKIVAQPIYSHVSSFDQGIAVVTRNNKQGLINVEGTYILKPKYDALTPINSSAWLISNNQLKGLASKVGVIILNPQFDQISFISHDLIIIKKGLKYGAIDINGVRVIPRMYEYIGYDNNYQALLLKQQPEKKVRLN